jgi:hypothetical protein
MRSAVLTALYALSLLPNIDGDKSRYKVLILRRREHRTSDREGPHQRADLHLLGHPVRQPVLHVAQFVEQVRGHGVGQLRASDQDAQLGGDVAQRVAEVRHALQFEKKEMLGRAANNGNLSALQLATLAHTATLGVTMQS